MKRALVLVALLVSCSSGPEVKPDSSGTSSGDASSSASSASSSTGSSGGGGASGLSCDPCENVDGTRIVRRKHLTTTSDGLVDVSVGGYFDLLRNESCSSLTAEDGMYRCLPTAFVSVRFADAACTVPISQINKCAPAPKTVISQVLDTGTCTQIYYVAYSVGAEHVGNSYTKASASCVLAAPVTDLHLLIKAQSSEFAPMTVESKP